MTKTLKGLMVSCLAVGSLSFHFHPPMAFKRAGSSATSLSSLSSTPQLSVEQIAALGDSETETANASEEKISVLVCPAQFCVPADYISLLNNLKVLESTGILTRPIGSFKVAPLPRTEWIKVARQLPTKAFLEARLPVVETLGWYFDAIDNAMAQIIAEQGSSTRICIIGHSIGGWVARAYLGGLSQSSTAIHKLAVKRVTSLITIGTPHISPIDAFVDQTRGLLRAIAEAPSCQPQALADRGIDVTCVCSDGLGGRVSTNVEELIAIASYLPLLGRLGGTGDGIVPMDLAFMDEPARRVVVTACEQTKLAIRHAHIVPTPWNLIDGYAPSFKLPEEKYPSYISPGVLGQWAKHIS
ncbi:hypothetical protein MPSEU_000501400 [Mayamaea pseudoterrestris]|nr:hypothetical protein MPSEU_000501400 [Mayamaea pseudoterrestris]